MAKRLTIDDLKTRRERVDDKVRRIRTTLEAHGIERAKIFSVENRRVYSAAGLADKEKQLRERTHASLTRWRTEIIDGVGDSFNHREQWSRDTMLRESRFFPAYVGSPGTVEAKIHSLLHELLEDTRRGNAERRAARLSSEDLAAEAARAAENGDIATVSVLINEAKSRKLQGEEKLAFDMAMKKLVLPESEEAEAVYSDLEALTDEADVLLELWRNPRSEVAAGRESLHRFNRRKRAEQIVRETEEEGERQKAEAEAKKLQAPVPLPAPDFPDEPEPQQSSAA